MERYLNETDRPLTIAWVQVQPPGSSPEWVKLQQAAIAPGDQLSISAPFGGYDFIAIS